VFEGTLKELIAEMEAKLPSEHVCGPVTVDAGMLETVCNRLVKLLKEDDAEAGDLFKANSDLLKTAFPLEFSGIEATISGFDFEAALAALEKVIKKLGKL
jgi:hypothetical protein